MTGVQLIGISPVISAFESMDCNAWSLYQGKQFIVSGTGSQGLGKWLSDFKDSGSTATYMLRVYDCDDPPTAATGSQDYNACVAFKLVDTYEGSGIAGHNAKLMERIGALEEQLKESDDTDLNSIIMGWLSDPVKLGQVAGAVRQIMGPGGGQGLPVAATPLQTIAGVGGVPASGQDDEAKLTRIAAALDELEKRDPKLIEHLEKLAKLAKTDQSLFISVIAKLDVL